MHKVLKEFDACPECKIGTLRRYQLEGSASSSKDFQCTVCEKFISVNYCAAGVQYRYAVTEISQYKDRMK